MTRFKTAKEAFKQWKLDDQYLDDPDGGGSNPEETYANAHHVLKLAEAESLKLEELVSDPEVRKRLESHAEEHETIEKHLDDFHESLDDPLEN